MEKLKRVVSGLLAVLTISGLVSGCEKNESTKKADKESVSYVDVLPKVKLSEIEVSQYKSRFEDLFAEINAKGVLKLKGSYEFIKIETISDDVVDKELLQELFKVMNILNQNENRIFYVNYIPGENVLDLAEMLSFYDVQVLFKLEGKTDMKAVNKNLRELNDVGLSVTLYSNAIEELSESIKIVGEKKGGLLYDSSLVSELKDIVNLDYEFSSLRISIDDSSKDLINDFAAKNLQICVSSPIDVCSVKIREEVETVLFGSYNSNTINRLNMELPDGLKSLIIESKSYKEIDLVNAKDKSVVVYLNRLDDLWEIKDCDWLNYAKYAGQKIKSDNGKYLVYNGKNLIGEIAFCFDKEGNKWVQILNYEEERAKKEIISIIDSIEETGNYRIHYSVNSLMINELKENEPNYDLFKELFEKFKLTGQKIVYNPSDTFSLDINALALEYPDYIYRIDVDFTFSESFATFVNGINDIKQLQTNLRIYDNSDVEAVVNLINKVGIANGSVRINDESNNLINNILDGVDKENSFSSLKIISKADYYDEALKINSEQLDLTLNQYAEGKVINLNDNAKGVVLSAEKDTEIKNIYVSAAEGSEIESLRISSVGSHIKANIPEDTKVVLYGVLNEEDLRLIALDGWLNRNYTTIFLKEGRIVVKDGIPLFYNKENELIGEVEINCLDQGVVNLLYTYPKKDFVLERTKKSLKLI